MYELENKKCSKPPHSIYPITEHVILNMLNLPLTTLYHNYISIYPHKMAMKVHVSCLNLEKKKHIIPVFVQEIGCPSSTSPRDPWSCGSSPCTALQSAHGTRSSLDFLEETKIQRSRLGKIYSLDWFVWMFVWEILPGNQSVFAMKKPWGCPVKTLPETNRHDLRRNHQVWWFIKHAIFQNDRLLGGSSHLVSAT